MAKSDSVNQRSGSGSGYDSTFSFGDFLNLSDKYLSLNDQSTLLFKYLHDSFFIFSRHNNGTSLEGYLSARSAERAVSVYQAFDTFHVRYAEELKEVVSHYLTGSVEPVPKSLHFILLEPPSEIQLDYITAWARINPDYDINLWTDPGFVLALDLTERIRQQVSQELLSASDASEFTVELTERIISGQNGALEEISENLDSGQTEAGALYQYLTERFHISSDDLRLQARRYQDALSDARLRLLQSREHHPQRAGIWIRELSTLWHGDASMLSYYQQHFILGDLQGAENLVRLEILRQLGGIVVEPDALPGIASDWYADINFPEVSEDLKQGAITQVVLSQLQDQFPARAGSLAESYRNYVQDLDRLMPGIATQLQTAVTKTSQLFEPIGDLQLPPETLGSGMMHGRLSEKILASPPGSRFIEQACQQVIQRYGLMAETGVKDIFSRQERHDVSFSLLDNLRRTRQPMYLLKLADYRLDLLSDNTLVNHILSGSELLLEAIFRELNLLRDQLGQADISDVLRHPLWGNAQTEESLAFDLSADRSERVRQFAEQYPDQPQFVIRLSESAPVIKASLYIDRRYSQGSHRIDLKELSHLDFASLFDEFRQTGPESPESAEVIVVGQAEIVQGRLLVSGMTPNRLAATLAPLNHSETSGSLRLLDLFEGDISLNSRLFEDYHRQLLAALEDRGWPINRFSASAHLTQIDHLGRSWVARFNQGQLAWQEGFGAHFHYQRQRSGQWLSETSKLPDTEYLRSTERSPIARIQDQSLGLYRQLMSELGLANLDNQFFAIQWQIHDFDITLELDGLIDDNDGFTRFYYSPEVIRDLKEQISTALETIDGYSHFPRDFPRTLTFLVSERKQLNGQLTYGADRNRLAKNLVYTGDRLTVILDASVLDTSLPPYRLPGLSEPNIPDPDDAKEQNLNLSFRDEPYIFDEHLLDLNATASGEGSGEPDYSAATSAITSASTTEVITTTAQTIPVTASTSQPVTGSGSGSGSGDGLILTGVMENRVQSILLHQLALAVFERLNPQLFWQEYSASHGDGPGCIDDPESLQTPSSSPVADSRQTVSKLATGTLLEFVGESLAARMAGIHLPLISAGELDWLLPTPHKNYRFIPDRLSLQSGSGSGSGSDLGTDLGLDSGSGSGSGSAPEPLTLYDNEPSGHYQLLDPKPPAPAFRLLQQNIYYGWDNRLSQLQSNLKQIQDRSWLKHILGQEDVRAFRGESFILSGLHEGREKHYQVLSSAFGSQVLALDTGSLLLFQDHERRQNWEAPLSAADSGAADYESSLIAATVPSGRSLSESELVEGELAEKALGLKESLLTTLQELAREFRLMVGVSPGRSLNESHPLNENHQPVLVAAFVRLPELDGYQLAEVADQIEYLSKQVPEDIVSGSVPSKLLLAQQQAALERIQLNQQGENPMINTEQPVLQQFVARFNDAAEDQGASQRLSIKRSEAVSMPVLFVDETGALYLNENDSQFTDILSYYQNSADYITPVNLSYSELRRQKPVLPDLALDSGVSDLRVQYQHAFNYEPLNFLNSDQQSYSAYPPVLNEPPMRLQGGRFAYSVYGEGYRVRKIDNALEIELYPWGDYESALDVFRPVIDLSGYDPADVELADSQLQHDIETVTHLFLQAYPGQALGVFHAKEVFNRLGEEQAGTTGTLQVVLQRDIALIDSTVRLLEGRRATVRLGLSDLELLSSQLSGAALFSLLGPVMVHIHEEGSPQRELAASSFYLAPFELDSLGGYIGLTEALTVTQLTEDQNKNLIYTALVQDERHDLRIAAGTEADFRYALEDLFLSNKLTAALDRVMTYLRSLPQESGSGRYSEADAFINGLLSYHDQLIDYQQAAKLRAAAGQANLQWLAQNFPAWQTALLEIEQQYQDDQRAVRGDDGILELVRKPGGGYLTIYDPSETSRLFSEQPLLYIAEDSTNAQWLPVLGNGNLNRTHWTIQQRIDRQGQEKIVLTYRQHDLQKAYLWRNQPQVFNGFVVEEFDPSSRSLFAAIKEHDARIRYIPWVNSTGDTDTGGEPAIAGHIWLNLIHINGELYWLEREADDLTGVYAVHDDSAPPWPARKISDPGLPLKLIFDQATGRASEQNDRSEQPEVFVPGVTSVSIANVTMEQYLLIESEDGTLYQAIGKSETGSHGDYGVFALAIDAQQPLYIRAMPANQRQYNLHDIYRSDPLVNSDASGSFGSESGSGSGIGIEEIPERLAIGLPYSYSYNPRGLHRYQRFQPEQLIWLNLKQSLTGRLEVTNGLASLQPLLKGSARGLLAGAGSAVNSGGTIRGSRDGGTDTLRLFYVQNWGSENSLGVIFTQGVIDHIRAQGDTVSSPGVVRRIRYLLTELRKIQDRRYFVNLSRSNPEARPATYQDLIDRNLLPDEIQHAISPTDPVPEHLKQIIVLSGSEERAQARAYNAASATVDGSQRGSGSFSVIELSVDAVIRNSSPEMVTRNTDFLAAMTTSNAQLVGGQKNVDPVTLENLIRTNLNLNEISENPAQQGRLRPYNNPGRIGFEEEFSSVPIRYLGDPVGPDNLGSNFRLAETQTASVADKPYFALAVAVSDRESWLKLVSFPRPLDNYSDPNYYKAKQLLVDTLNETIPDRIGNPIQSIVEEYNQRLGQLGPGASIYRLATTDIESPEYLHALLKGRTQHAEVQLSGFRANVAVEYVSIGDPLSGFSRVFNTTPYLTLVFNQAQAQAISLSREIAPGRDSPWIRAMLTQHLFEEYRQATGYHATDGLFGCSVVDAMVSADNAEVGALKTYIEKQGGVRNFEAQLRSELVEIGNATGQSGRADEALRLGSDGQKQFSRAVNAIFGDAIELRTGAGGEITDRLTLPKSTESFVPRTKGSRDTIYLPGMEPSARRPMGVNRGSGEVFATIHVLNTQNPVSQLVLQTPQSLDLNGRLGYLQGHSELGVNSEMTRAFIENVGFAYDNFEQSSHFLLDQRVTEVLSGLDETGKFRLGHSLLEVAAFTDTPTTGVTRLAEHLLNQHATAIAGQMKAGNKPARELQLQVSELARFTNKKAFEVRLPGESETTRVRLNFQKSPLDSRLSSDHSVLTLGVKDVLGIKPEGDGYTRLPGVEPGRTELALTGRTGDPLGFSENRLTFSETKYREVVQQGNQNVSAQADVDALAHLYSEGEIGSFRRTIQALAQEHEARLTLGRDIEFVLRPDRRFYESRLYVPEAHSSEPIRIEVGTSDRAHIRTQDFSRSINQLYGVALLKGLQSREHSQFAQYKGIIQTVYRFGDRELAALGDKVGLRTSLELLPLPENTDTLYHALVGNLLDHDLKAGTGTHEDYQGAFHYLQGEEIFAGAVDSALEYIVIHGNTPDTQVFISELVHYYNDLSKQEARAFRGELGNNRLNRLKGYATESRERLRLSVMATLANRDERIAGGTALSPVTSDSSGSHYEFHTPSEVHTRPGRLLPAPPTHARGRTTRLETIITSPGGTHFLVNSDVRVPDSRFVVSRPTSPQSPEELARAGAGARCRRQGDSCALNPINEEEIADRGESISEGLISDAREGSTGYARQRFIEYEGVLYRVISAEGQPLRGEPLEGSTAVSAAYAEDAQFGAEVPLPGAEVDKVRTIVRNRESNQLLQLVGDAEDGAFPAVRFNEGEALFTPVVSIPTEEGQAPLYGVSVEDGNPEVRDPVVLIEEGDTVAGVMGAVEATESYLQEPHVLFALDDTDGTIMLVAHEEEFLPPVEGQERGSRRGIYSKKPEAFASYLFEYLTETPSGKALLQRLKNHEGTVRPGNISELDPALSGQAPEKLKLLIQLETPEQHAARENKIQVYDQTAATGSGTVAEVFVDPTMGLTGIDKNYQSRFTGTLMDIFDGVSYAVGQGGEDGIINIGREVLRDINTNVEGGELTRTSLENVVRTELNENLGYDNLPLSPSPTSIEVSTDETPRRLGFETEYPPYKVKTARGKPLPDDYARLPVAFTEGEVRGLPLIEIGTDLAPGGPLIEFISGPQTVDEYNNGVYYAVREVIEDQMSRIPRDHSISVEKWVNKVNSALDSRLGKGKYPEFRLSVNDRLPEGIRISNSGPENPKFSQININFDYAQFGDPLSNVSELIYSTKRDRATLFLAAQQEGHRISRLMGGESDPMLRAILSDFLYQGSVKHFYPGGDVKKTQEEFLARSGPADVIMSGASESTLKLIEDFYRQGALKAEVEASIGNLLDNYTALEKGSIDRQRVNLDVTNTFYEAVQMRRKYGKVQIPLDAYKLFIPVIEGGRDRLFTDSFNEPSRRPGTAHDGKFYVIGETRNFHFLDTLADRSPAELGHQAFLDRLQGTPAWEGNLAHLDDLITTVDRSFSDYAGNDARLRGFLKNELNRQLNGLSHEQFGIFEERYLFWARRDKNFATGQGSHEIAGHLQENRIRQAISLDVQGVSIPSGLVDKIVELGYLRGGVPKRLTVNDVEVLVSFNPNKGMRETGLAVGSRGEYIFEIGARNDLRLRRQGEGYKISSNQGSELTIRLEDSAGRVKLPNTELLADLALYKKVLLESGLRPLQLQNDINRIAFQALEGEAGGFSERLKVLASLGEIDLSTGRKIEIVLRPDLNHEKSRVDIPAPDEPAKEPIRISIGVREQIPDTVLLKTFSRLYGLALANSFGENAADSAARSLVEDVWRLDDSHVQALGRHVGLTESLTEAPLPENTGDLYHSMVGELSHDLSLRPGTAIDFHDALLSLDRRGQLSTAIEYAFERISSGDANIRSGEIADFYQALLDVYGELSDPVHGNRAEAGNFVEALGQRRLAQLQAWASDSANSETAARMAQQLDAIESTVRVNDGVADIVSSSDGSQHLILDPSEASFQAGGEKLEFLIRGGGQSDQQVYRVARNQAVYTPFDLVRNRENGELYLAEENSLQAATHLDRNADLYTEISADGLGTQQGTNISGDEFDRYRLLILQNENIGIEIPDALSSGDRPVLDVRFTDSGSDSLTDIVRGLTASENYLRGEAGGYPDGRILGFLDPDLQNVKVYISPEYAQGGFRPGQLKALAENLSLYARTQEGRAWLEGVNGTLNTTPGTIGDFPELTASRSARLRRIPENTHLLIAFDQPGSSRPAIQTQNGAHSLTVLSVDPSFSGRGGQLNQGTALYPKLAQALGELNPGAAPAGVNESGWSALGYENSVRRQMGLPEIRGSRYDFSLDTNTSPGQLAFTEETTQHLLQVNDSSAFNHFKTGAVLAETSGTLNGRPYLEIRITPEDGLRIEMPPYNSDSYTSESDFYRLRTLLDEALSDSGRDGSLTMQDVVERFNREVDKAYGADARPYRLDTLDPDLAQIRVRARADGDGAESHITASLAVEYESIGDPLSGFHRLLGDYNQKWMLEGAQLEAGLLVQGGEAHFGTVSEARIKSLFTQLLFQELQLNLANDSIGLGAGLSDVVAGIHSKEELIAIKRYINSRNEGHPGRFTTEVKEAIVRILKSAGITDIGVANLAGVDSHIENALGKAIDLRIKETSPGVYEEISGRFQLPVTDVLHTADGQRVQAGPGSREFIDPVANTSTRKPLVRNGERFFLQVEVDTLRTPLDAIVSAAPEAGGAGYIHRLQGVAGLGSDPAITRAFLNNLDTIFLDYGEPLHSLIRERISEVIRGMDTDSRTRLSEELINHIDQGVARGQYEQHLAREALGHAAAELLSHELGEVVRKTADHEPLARDEYARLNHLFTVAGGQETTVPLRLPGQAESSITIRFDPSLHVESSMGFRDSKTLVIGTGDANAMMGTAAYELIQELVNPSAELAGEELIALRLDQDARINGDHFEFSSFLDVLKAEPGRLSFRSTIDRLETAVKLADRLEAQGKPEQGGAIRQRVADALAILERQNPAALTYDKTVEGERRTFSAIDSGTEEFQSRLDSFRQRLVDGDLGELPPAGPAAEPRVLCRRSAGACARRSASELSAEDLDFISRHLDETLHSPELEQLRKSASASSNPELREAFRAVDQHRYAPVSPVSPADLPELKEKVIAEVLDIATHPGKLSSPDEAMDRILKVYEDAGYDFEAKFVREQLLKSEQFRAILNKMADPDAGLTELARVAEQKVGDAAVRTHFFKKVGKYGSSVRARWKRFKTLEDPLLIRISQNPHVARAQAFSGFGLSVFGIAQSTAALVNLLRYSDQIDPTTKAVGFTGVAMGYAGGAFGLAALANHLLTKQATSLFRVSLSAEEEAAGVLGVVVKFGIRRFGEAIGKGVKAAALATRVTSSIASFIPFVGAAVSIIAGAFMLGVDIKNAVDAGKFHNTDQVLFFSFNAVLDFTLIILDIASLALSELPPAAWLIDGIAILLTVVQIGLQQVAPPPNAYQDFNALIEGQGFKDFIKKLVENYADEGFRRLEFSTDASNYLAAAKYKENLESITTEVTRTLTDDIAEDTKGTVYVLNQHIYADSVHGTEFDDRFVAPYTDQNIYGGDGNDEIFRGLGPGKSFGGGGDDLISGGNYQEGNEGNDKLIHDLNSVVQKGGAGDEVHRPGTGYANLDGGPGNDTLIMPSPISSFEMGGSTYQMRLPSRYLFSIDMAEGTISNHFHQILHEHCYVRSRSWRLLGYRCPPFSDKWILKDFFQAYGSDGNALPRNLRRGRRIDFTPDITKLFVHHALDLEDDRRLAAANRGAPLEYNVLPASTIHYLPSLPKWVGPSSSTERALTWLLARHDYVYTLGQVNLGVVERFRFDVRYQGYDRVYDDINALSPRAASKYRKVFRYIEQVGYQRELLERGPAQRYLDHRCRKASIFKGICRSAIRNWEKSVSKDFYQKAADYFSFEPYCDANRITSFDWHRICSSMAFANFGGHGGEDWRASFDFYEPMNFRWFAFAPGDKDHTAYSDSWKKQSQSVGSQFICGSRYIFGPKGGGPHGQVSNLHWDRDCDDFLEVLALDYIDSTKVLTGDLYATETELIFVSGNYLVEFKKSWLELWSDRLEAERYNPVAHFYATLLDILPTYGTFKNIEYVSDSVYGVDFRGDNKANTFFGNNGYNRIKTFGGDDLVFTGKADDSVYAGEGNDQILVQGGRNYIDGGPHNDTVSYHRMDTGVNVMLANRDISQGDVLKNIETLQGTYFDDRLVGDDSNTLFLPLNGTNYIDTGGGNDTVITAGGQSEIWLRDGHNTVVLDDEPHSVYGGDGDDIIIIPGASNAGFNITDSGGTDWIISQLKPAYSLSFVRTRSSKFGDTCPGFSAELLFNLEDQTVRVVKPWLRATHKDLRPVYVKFRFQGHFPYIWKAFNTEDSANNDPAYNAYKDKDDVLDVTEQWSNLDFSSPVSMHEAIFDLLDRSQMDAGCGYYNPASTDLQG